MWTGKVPTHKQLKGARRYIKEEFGFDFEFPEYPPPPAEVARIKKFQEATKQSWEWDGLAATFHDDESAIKKTMGFLDLMGFGSRVRIERYTYDGYLQPAYILCSERAQVDTGVKDALAQIQKVLDLLPPSNRKFVLRTLSEKTTSSWKGHKMTRTPPPDRKFEKLRDVRFKVKLYPFRYSEHQSPLLQPLDGQTVEIVGVCRLPDENFYLTKFTAPEGEKDSDYVHDGRILLMRKDGEFVKYLGKTFEG